MITFKQFLAEAAKKMYQVRVETTAANGGWKDVPMFADSLDDIEQIVSASPMNQPNAHPKFDMGQLTKFVTDFIGDGPDGPGTSWDEMDMDVKSHMHGVLKISFHFSGVNTRRKEDVKRSGVISIMAGEEEPVDEDLKVGDLVKITAKKNSNYNVNGTIKKVYETGPRKYLVSFAPGDEADYDEDEVKLDEASDSSKAIDDEWTELSKLTTAELSKKIGKKIESTRWAKKSAIHRYLSTKHGTKAIDAFVKMNESDYPRGKMVGDPRVLHDPEGYLGTRSKKPDQSDDVKKENAYNRGFRGAFSNALGDDTGIGEAVKKYFEQGMKDGQAARRKHKDIPVAFTKNMYGEKKKNAEFEKVVKAALAQQRPNFD